MIATEDTRRSAEDAPLQQPREKRGDESRESHDAALTASALTAYPAVPTAPAAPPIATRALSNRGNPVLFATMLDLRAVCRLSLVSRATRNTYGRRARKACLTEGGGVPEDCRVEFWKCALNVDKVGVPFVWFLGRAFIAYTRTHAHTFYMWECRVRTVRTNHFVFLRRGALQSHACCLLWEAVETSKGRWTLAVPA